MLTVCFWTAGPHPNLGWLVLTFSWSLFISYFFSWKAGKNYIRKCSNVSLHGTTMWSISQLNNKSEIGVRYKLSSSGIYRNNVVRFAQGSQRFSDLVWKGNWQNISFFWPQHLVEVLSSQQHKTPSPVLVMVIVQHRRSACITRLALYCVWCWFLNETDFQLVPPTTETLMPLH